MFDRQLLFASGEGGYVTYRIPAIVATPTGTVLAFAAARKDFSDWADIDLAMRRSEDGGVSWGPVQIITGVGLEEPTDNPVPIFDRQTAEIHFLFQQNYERVFWMKSDDDGRTFLKPKEITEVLEQFRSDYPWQVVAPGPGHGLQMQNGRLVVPVWMSTGEGTEFGAGHKGHRPSEVSVIYSDDHGETWNRGAMAVHNTAEVVNPNETTIEQLSDGRVMLNVRSETDRYRRVIVTSTNGADGWSDPKFHDELYEPICFASMIRAPGAAGGLLFTNPDSSAKPDTGWKSRMPNAASARLRENLTIRLSRDDGATWPMSRVIDPGVAGYSDLAVTGDGTILCLYEHGGRMAQNSGMSVVRLDTAWILEGGN